ncbi:MAG TPA: MFS transporter, partial [Candidatus Binatia bacterium]|nr:MFS transporter [Candidatus Binatia bacterium]
MAAQNPSAPSRNRWWSLLVASLATLIVTADSGQLSIALPLIVRDLHADLTLASWVALVYALITASLYLPCGRLSDLFGIGKLFLAGFLLYAASSLGAAMAQGAGQLIFFRALQAAGSALIMANNFALVTALFPPEERGRAMGIAGGTVSALGYTMGPVL